MKRSSYQFIPEYDPAGQRRESKSCEKIGCAGIGEYPAPKSPENLKDNLWFCKEHVMEYNLAWDYFKDKSGEEIARHHVERFTWERETKPFGTNGGGFWNTHISDPFEFLGAAAMPTKPDLPHGVLDALKVMNLTHPLTLSDLKERYKELVKEHHPDLHQGDKTKEHILKKVNLAYIEIETFLKKP